MLATQIKDRSITVLPARPRVAFYCQHSVGLGHLMRTLRLASGLRIDAEIIIICGGSMPASIPLADDLHVITLAPLAMHADGTLYDPAGDRPAEAILEERAAYLGELAATLTLDAVIVEMYPFGRKKFRAEILSLVNSARRHSAATIICSVRDILVTSRRDQERFDNNALERLNQEFDLVLVHADPAFVGLDVSFPHVNDIRIPLHYTGYIGPQITRDSDERAPRVMVSAGGGRVGQRLREAAAAAAPAIKREFGLSMTIVAGALAADSAAARRDDDIEYVDFIADFPAALSDTRLSISQCGYNTFADVLAAGTPAVYVPFETPREDEQLRRAQFSEQRGIGALVREVDLTPETLLDAARRALALQPAALPAADGVRQARQRILECIEHVRH
ncbi:MAG: hypothetical protein H6978_06710 [Gammaproteobacteria bacterium]|nr:hypothetical protein [Gammaproteobacteria bacterium]